MRIVRYSLGKNTRWDRKGRCRLGTGMSSEVQECINSKNTAAVLTLQPALADEYEKPKKRCVPRPKRIQM